MDTVREAAKCCTFISYEADKSRSLKPAEFGRNSDMFKYVEEVKLGPCSTYGDSLNEPKITN